MTDEPTTPLAVDPFLEDGASPQTPFEALRAKRDEIAARTTVLIPLGQAYEEIGICAKYRLIGRDEVDRISERNRSVQKHRSEFIYRMLVDSMIVACEGFFLKPANIINDDDAEPLKSPDGSEVITTYHQFALHLRGTAFETHRASVLYTFGDNEFAVAQHGMILQRWFNNTGLEVDQELLEG